uniref:Ubiquitin-like protease family profile domain-containing protein n=1 Tax=Chenopodium quinoa TaxID=63459 RepID=A0A803N986_CHEQI
MKGRGQGKAIKGSGKDGKGGKGKGGKGRSNGREGMRVEDRSSKQVIEYQVESCDESYSESSSSGSMSESDFEYEPEPEVDLVTAMCSDDVSQCYSSGDEVRKAQRKARRKRKIDPKVFVDNSKTLGGKVKEAGIVIASFKSKKKAMNVNCLVETLGRILGSFDESKQRGVHWVLGLPYGPKVVPKKVVNQELEDRLWNTYSTKTTCGTRGITRKTLVQYLEGPCVDEDEFKKVFLMYVLSVLCSSTCHRMKKQFLHGVLVADNAPLYNWCEFVLDELMKALGQFSKRFYGDDLNFNASSGGCTLFLAVFYLDRLNRSPLKWGEFPRIKVGSRQEMNKASSADKFDSGDYGALGCVNVNYGRDHPLKAGDILPCRSKRSKDCVQSEEILSNSDVDVSPLVWTITQSVCGPFNGDASAPNHQYILIENPINQYRGPKYTLGNGCSNFSETNVFDGLFSNIRLDSPPFCGQEQGMGQEITFESEDEPVTPLKLRTAAQKEMLRRKPERSRRQRKIVGVQTLPIDYVIHWRPKYIRRFREPLLQYVMDNSSGRLWSLDNEPTMLSIDGHMVKLNLCGMFASCVGEVCDQYVRVASKIYEKVWDKQFAGKSRRFMLDPSFGTMVLNAKGVTQKIQRTIKAYCKHMMETPTNRVNVVFVPICRDGHWWCVAFSMNREEVIVIDSLETKNACDTRSLEVHQLVKHLTVMAAAMDLVFQSMDRSWQTGTATDWRRSSLEMEQQGDIHSCGVHMIIAVKRNAHKFLKIKPPVEDMLLERSWILCEDLLSEFNESRDVVLDIIKPLVL